MDSRSQDVLPLLSGPALWRCYQAINPTWKLKFKFLVSEKNAQLDAIPNIHIANENNDKNFLFNTIVPANYDENQECGRVVLGTIVRRKNIPVLVDYHNVNKNKKFTDGKLHIFSVTDYWEVGEKEEAQPEDWNNIGAVHHQIPMTDFKSEIVPEVILAAVYEMRKILEENPNNTIYVHCKAGKARSAMIVSTYTSIFGECHNINLGEKPDILMGAHYAKTKRRQVNLHQDSVSEYGISRLYDVKSAGKIHKAQKAIDLHYELTHDLSCSDKELTVENYINEFNEYMSNRMWPHGHTPIGNTLLSTLEFKNKLIHSTEFKQLMILCVNSSLSSALQNDIETLFSEIYHATDDSWLSMLDKISINKLHAKEESIIAYLDAIKNIAAEFINTANQADSSYEETQQMKTWHRVNDQINIASDLQTGLVKQNWSASSRTLHPVIHRGKNEAEEIRAPLPIIAMLDKIDLGMYEYNTDNTMGTALKQIASIALLESITEKNSRIEIEYYKKFSNLIDIGKSILNIRNEIETSHFKVHGLNTHETINNDAVPKHVKQIYNICIDTMAKNDINKIIQILIITKQNAASGISNLSSMFNRDEITNNFYHKIARHLVLKEVNELKLAAQYILGQELIRDVRASERSDKITI